MGRGLVSSVNQLSVERNPATPVSEIHKIHKRSPLLHPATYILFLFYTLQDRKLSKHISCIKMFARVAVCC